MPCMKKRDGRVLIHKTLEVIRIHAVQREKAQRTLSGSWPLRAQSFEMA